MLITTLKVKLFHQRFYWM